MSDTFLTLFRYQAWANAEALEAIGALEGCDPVSLLALLDHADVVASIFRGHLSGQPHGHADDVSEFVPPLADLKARMAATDAWYLEHIVRTPPEASVEPIVFTFTDGETGTMTRAEMLLHVALHATVHRGEVARLLRQAGKLPPWETLAVHLHRAQPERRQGEIAPRAA